MRVYGKEEAHLKAYLRGNPRAYKETETSQAFCLALVLWQSIVMVTGQQYGHRLPNAFTTHIIRPSYP